MLLSDLYSLLPPALLLTDEAGLLWFICAPVLVGVPLGRLDAEFPETVTAGRLVDVPVLFTVVPEGLAVDAVLPDTRDGTPALFLSAGVVLTTELLLDVPRSALVDVPDVAALLLLMVLLLPMPPLVDVLLLKSRSEPV